jgi:hypothetical protein
LKRNTLSLLACAALAAGVLGCGSDEEGAPIPADSAQELETRLGEIQRRFEFGRGACADIVNDSEPAVRRIIASLPQDVDEDVRTALEDGFERLFSLSADQCESEPAETETEATPEPPETDTETVPAETLETETIPTETLPPETESTPDENGPPEVPPGQEDGGNGQGGSGGVGPLGEE